jgi:hypothetical protein
MQMHFCLVAGPQPGTACGGIRRYLTLTDHTAKLYGHVHSIKEASAAEAAAALAPGIARVESHLVVSP